MFHQISNLLTKIFKICILEFQTSLTFINHIL
jgi:hypothetical protein